MIVVILAVVAGSVVGRIVRARRRCRRHEAQLDRCLPEAIDMIAAVLRAGHSPIEALSIVATHVDPVLRPAFEAAERESCDGGRFVDSLGALERALGSRVRPLVDALEAGHRLGVPLDRMVDQLASDAHAIRRRHLERSARELSIGLSLPLVMCILPSFLLLVVAPTLIGTLSSLDISF